MCDICQPETLREEPRGRSSPRPFRRDSQTTNMEYCRTRNRTPQSPSLHRLKWPACAARSVYSPKYEFVWPARFRPGLRFSLPSLHHRSAHRDAEGLCRPFDMLDKVIGWRRDLKVIGCVAVVTKKKFSSCFTSGSYTSFRSVYADCAR